MSFNNFLERKLYLLVAVILAIFCLTVNFNSFGLNKTAGMAYDMGTIAKLVCLASLLLSFIGYSILALLKYRTQKVLSLIYVSDILPAVIVSHTQVHEVSIIFGIMSRL